jgi:TPR repeat protein
MKVQQQRRVKETYSSEVQDAFEYAMQYACADSSSAELVQALKWLIIADAQGHRKAATYRIDIARELSLSEIVEAQREARLWIAKQM